MDSSISADDLWPLILKLNRGERIRLAKLALRASASGSTDALAYREMPAATGEFSADEDPLAWDAGGWEEFDASR